MTRRLLLSTLLALLALLTLGSGARAADDTQSELHYEMPERIVVVSSVGGYHEDFERLLRRIGLIDDNADWIGGETHLVQLGNMFGPGPQLTEGIELLMKLEEQAESAGGKVHALHGRTENMVLRGDLSRFQREPESPLYVTYAGPTAEAELRDYIDDRVERYEKDMRAAGEPEKIIIAPIFRNYVRRLSEIGGPEFLATLAPGTEMGDWLRSRPAVVRIGDYIFSFGGVHEKYADATLEEINADALANLRNDVIFHPRLVDKESPVWWSGMATTRSLDKTRRAEWLLWKRDARAMVVGLPIDPYYPSIEGRVVHVNSRFDYPDEHPPIAVQIVEGGDRLFYLNAEDDPARIPPPSPKRDQEPVQPRTIRERQRPNVSPMNGDGG